MAKKQAKKSSVKKVKVVELKEDKPRASSLLRNLILNFPFNPFHQKFTVFQGTYRLIPYTIKFWEYFSKQMNTLGHLNENLLTTRDLYRFRTSVSVEHYEPQIGEMISEAILQNVFGKWSSSQKNGSYRESPQFVIFRDFLQILNSFLLPNKVTWKDLLSDPFDNGGRFSYLFTIQVKRVDPTWTAEITNQKNEIVKKEIDSYDLASRKLIVESIVDSSQDKTVLNVLLALITTKEHSVGIPPAYQTTTSDVEKYLEREIQEMRKTKGSISGVPPVPLPPNANRYDTTSFEAELSTTLEFGLHSPATVFPVCHSPKSGEKYLYENFIDLVWTPETLSREFNRILSLCFGHSDFQLGVDGILRYLGSSEESHQTQSMIQTFMDNRLDTLLPLVDKVLESLEKAQWNDVAKHSRTLMEDFIRAVLSKKTLVYGPKATLNDLIELLRNNASAIFHFPIWCTSDPKDDFDHLLQGMKTIEKLTNPASHTAAQVGRYPVQVQKHEAIVIKNTVFMFMITLAGFLS